MTNASSRHDQSPGSLGMAFDCPNCSRPIRVVREFLTEGGIACPCCEMEFHLTRRTSVGTPAVAECRELPRSLTDSKKLSWTTVGTFTLMSLIILGGVGMAALGSGKDSSTTSQSQPKNNTASVVSEPTNSSTSGNPVSVDESLTSVPTAPAVADVKPLPAKVPSAEAAESLAKQALAAQPEVLEATTQPSVVIEAPSTSAAKSAPLPARVSVGDVADPPVLPTVREWKDNNARVLAVGTFFELRNGVEVVIRETNGALEAFALPALSVDDRQYVLTQTSVRPAAQPVVAQQAPVPTTAPIDPRASEQKPSEPNSESATGVDRHFIAVPVGPSSRRNRRGDFIRDFRPQLMPVEVPPQREYAFPMELPGP